MKVATKPPPRHGQRAAAWERSEQDEKIEILRGMGPGCIYSDMHFGYVCVEMAGPAA